MPTETTAALGNGVLLGKFAWEVGDYVNGALHETCDASNDTVTTLRNLTATAAVLGRRLIYQCHGGCTIDELAAFLAGAGPAQAIGTCVETCGVECAEDLGLTGGGDDDAGADDAG